MTDTDSDSTYARPDNVYTFTKAIKDLLGEDELCKLRTNWDRTNERWFGDYLCKHEPEVFMRVVTFMKVTGKW